MAGNISILYRLYFPGLNNIPTPAEVVDRNFKLLLGNLSQTEIAIITDTINDISNKLAMGDLQNWHASGYTLPIMRLQPIDFVNPEATTRPGWTNEAGLENLKRVPYIIAKILAYQGFNVFVRMNEETKKLELLCRVEDKSLACCQLKHAPVSIFSQVRSSDDQGKPP